MSSTLQEDNKVIFKEDQYHNVLADLMDHTGIFILSVIAVIFAVYAMSKFYQATLIFVGLCLFVFILVLYCVWSHPVLKVRVPILCSTTAMMAWGFNQAGHASPWAREVVCSATIFLFGYYLKRAIGGSISEYVHHKKQHSVGEAVASLLAGWGAFLLLFWSLSPTIALYVRCISQNTILGKALMASILFLERYSSVLLPIGVFSLGIVTYASLRLREYPYYPCEFKGFLNTSNTDLCKLFLSSIPAIPLWISRTIIGFVLHFTKQLYFSIRLFFADWLARFILVLYSLVLPTVLLFWGHSLFMFISLQTSHYLAADGHYSVVDVLLTFLCIHVAGVFALSFYLVATLLLSISIVETSLRDLEKTVRIFLSSTGIPAFKKIGMAFSLFGVIFFAVPLSSMIRPSQCGFFSLVYGTFFFAIICHYMTPSFVRCFRERTSVHRKQRNKSDNESHFNVSPTSDESISDQVTPDKESPFNGSPTSDGSISDQVPPDPERTV